MRRDREGAGCVDLYGRGVVDGVWCVVGGGGGQVVGVTGGGWGCVWEEDIAALCCIRISKKIYR